LVWDTNDEEEGERIIERRIKGQWLRAVADEPGDEAKKEHTHRTTKTCYLQGIYIYIFGNSPEKDTDWYDGEDKLLKGNASDPIGTLFNNVSEEEKDRHRNHDGVQK